MQQNPTANVPTLTAEDEPKVAVEKSFAAPQDSQWYLRKQRPTQFGDNKNRPRLATPKISDPMQSFPESVKEFAEKHGIVLSKENEPIVA